MGAGASSNRLEKLQKQIAEDAAKNKVYQPSPLASKLESDVGAGGLMGEVFG